MRIPPYWTRGSYSSIDRNGRETDQLAYGWSFESMEAAHADAVARAKRLFERVDSFESPDVYEYSEKPLREEIYRQIVCDGEEIAVITRNRYGSLVLNTPSVCFVDIDFPYLGPRGLLDEILLLFSRKRREARRQEAIDLTMSSVRIWIARNNNRSFRLYRTAVGLRVLFTDRLYNPTSEETVDLLAQLGSDPLYCRLTHNQECFRARLTPKPWRCGSERPRWQYPFVTEEREQEYRQWQRSYETNSSGYGVCELLEAQGPIPTDGPIATIVDIHDKYTCRNDGAKLA